MTPTSELSWWQIIHAGSSAPDLPTFLARTPAVGASLRSVGQAMVLICRDEAEPRVFLSCPASTHAPMLASNIASAVGGRHLAVDEPPPLNTDDGIRQLIAHPGRSASHQSQTGGDPGEVAAFVARALPPNSWFAATLRVATKRETTRVRRWYTSRTVGASAMHYTNRPHLMLASLYVGGDVDLASEFLGGLVAMLPGFELDTVVAAPAGRIKPTALGLTEAIGFAGGATYLSADPKIIAVGSGLGFCTAVLTGSGLIPSPHDRLARTLAHGTLPTPGTKPGWQVRRPRKATTNNDGRTVERPGNYPLRSDVVALSTDQMSSLACPHFGAMSGAAATRTHDVPGVLTTDIGPLVGFDGTGQRPIHLSSADLWSGAIVTGAAGTGKSVTIHQLFAYDSLERVAPTHRPGHPGRNNTLIVFESKGADGAQAYLDWLAATGDAAHVVDLGDPNSLTIDMIGRFNPDLSLTERAETFVSAMVYAFGEQAIGYRSANTLRQVLAVSFAVDPDDFTAVGLPSTMTFIDAAQVLLGARGDTLGQTLHHQLETKVVQLPADDPRRAQLFDALQLLEQLYGPKVTPATRRGLQEAPVSKIGVLASVNHWWSPSRRAVSFDTIIEKHQCVIINTGSPIAGGALPNDEVTGRLSAMLMHQLRRVIASHCTGWRTQGRSVTLFSDELSLLAGSSPEVFTWLRNQGRSFGVRQALATQYPEQLADGVRKAVMGFGTRIWYTQNERSIIDQAVAALTADGSDWQPSDLATMPQYHAIVSATVANQTQPAVMATMKSWEDDRASFAAAQGFVHPR